MVGSHKASGVLLVLLVVMATTIANGTPVVDTAKNAATAVEDTAKNAATAVGGAAASVGAKVSGAKPGAAVDVKASGAKGDSKTDDSAVRTKCLLYILYYTSFLYCLRKNFTLIHACIYRHLRLHGKKLVQQGAQLQCQKVSIW